MLIEHFRRKFSRAKTSGLSTVVIAKMVYPSSFEPVQPNAMRILNRKNLELEPRKRFSAKDLTRALRTSAWTLADKFAKRSTIHGMSRLVDNSAGKYERTVWLLGVILALFGAIYVCLILSERFREGKFETVVDSTRNPVYRIYFPVVSICNLNRLNWERIEEAKRRFLPNEKSNATLQLFERIVGAYDDIRFANFDKFRVLENEPLQLLNHVNFSLVVDFMTWRCEEFVGTCLWRHMEVNCCEVFSKRRTKSGLCWAFNSLETEEGRRMKRLDPKWPWRTGAAGPYSGLHVRVYVHPDKHFPNRTNEKGISVMVTEPYVWHKDPFDVPENTETMVELDPVIYFYDNDTRIVSSDQRQCVFDTEQNSRDFKSLYGYIYMIENCQSECHQEYIMRYCNCTVDLLFPPGQYPSCKATDLLCLAKHNEFFLYSHQPGEEQFVKNDYEGMVCKCLRNCYSLNYITDVRPSFLPAEVRNNVSYVDLDVHFRFETMMVYRTSLVFGWVDLMVAFGGIAGLFLGCSLISAMELAYFTIIELPSFLYEKCKSNRQKQRVVTPKSDMPEGKFGFKNRILVQNQLEEYISNSKQLNQPEQLSPWNRLIFPNASRTHK